jgi:hypothetical protein
MPRPPRAVTRGALESELTKALAAGRFTACKLGHLQPVSWVIKSRAGFRPARQDLLE